jgi:hypothetical protein
MYRASFEVASAFKCGTRVFAHSGGGTVIGLIMRLLDADAGVQTRIQQWPVDKDGNKIPGSFVVIGLEAVLSKEVVITLNALPSFKVDDQHGRAVVVNYVAKTPAGIILPDGSLTWLDPIAKEIKSVGQDPLETQPIAFGPLKNIKGLPNIESVGDIFLHGRIAFYVLINGTLPPQFGARGPLPSPLGN